MEISRYAKRGFYLFPIASRSKIPTMKDPLNRASIDLPTLKTWAVRFKGCNYGLALARSGLVCVDIDAGGMPYWLDLIFEHGEPETLKAFSGSGKGLHYVFKAKPGMKYRGRLLGRDKKLTRGIDVKHNGYIVVEPSIHVDTGKPYKWESFDVEPAEMPEWLAALSEKRAEEKEARTDTVDVSEFKEAAAFLKEASFGYDEWLRIGMALHAATKGAPEGLELYLDITQGANHKPGDVEAARTKWASFREGGGIHAGTFFEIANQLGFTGSDPFSDFEAVEGDNKELWKISKAGLKVTKDPVLLIDALNDMGYALLKGTYEGQIIKHWMTPTGAKHFKMMSSEHFRNSLKALAYLEKLKNGQKKLRPAADLWLESNFKKTYNNVVFRPVAEEGDLNLWSGIPCEPLEGDVSLFLELAFVLCGKHEAKYQYFLKWLGHLFQKPEIKPVIVPVFIGEQGAGKGMFFDAVLGRILTGDYYSRLDKPGVIKERFNAEQARKFLTVLDEASWRGDHELNGILKSLTGSPTMTIEEKFGGRYSIENYSRYAILSNDIEAVRIETSNRRYLIFNTAMDWKGTNKFKELAAALDAGAHKAFYDYLLKLNLEGFDPYSFPFELDTETSASKAASFGPAGKFWYELFTYSPKPLWEPSGKILATQAWTSFSLARPNLKFYQLTDFVNETASIVPSLRHIIQRAEWELTPFQLMTAFFKDNRLPIPGGFDDLDYIDFNLG